MRRMYRSWYKEAVWRGRVGRLMERLCGDVEWIGGVERLCREAKWDGLAMMLCRGAGGGGC